MSQTARSSRTIRLPADEVEALILRLQQPASRGSADEPADANVTVTFLARNVSINVAQPGGAVGQFLVDTVALGPTRLRFIHGGFLHAGSDISARLMTLDNAWRDIRGDVRQCRHVERGVHEVVMGWDGVSPAIELCEFIAATGPRVRVLLLDDSAAIRALVVHFLREFRAEITQAESCAAAKKAFVSAPCDVAFVDLELPDGSGLDLVRGWREKGSQVYMVALTGRTDPAERATIMAAGFDAFIGKPFDRDQIAAAFRAVVSEAVRSPMNDNPEMKPLCEAYVRDLPRVIEQVTAAMRAKDLATITHLVHEICSSAACYQFQQIASAAEKLTADLKPAENLDAVAQDVAKLISLCRRATTQ